MRVKALKPLSLIKAGVDEMERESYEYDGVVGHRVVEMPDGTYRLETIFTTGGHVYILKSETVRPKEA